MESLGRIWLELKDDEMDCDTNFIAERNDVGGWFVLVDGGTMQEGITEDIAR